MSDECIFCQFASGKKAVEIVAHYESCFVIKDGFPVSKGHLLIIPYQHITDWFSAPVEVHKEIISIIDEMKVYLDTSYKPDGYNIGANCGKAAGQTVMHLHFHIIPRYAGDMDDPRGGIRGCIPSKQKY
jgi:diadenosine tetraphosphate (Ap4A) HIT family hydrolase